MIEQKIKDFNNNLKFSKSLHFDDNYNHFYNKIIIFKTVNSIRYALNSIKKNIINKLPNLFFKLLKDIMGKQSIEEIFKPILDITVTKNQIIKIDNIFEKDKNNFIPRASIFEFGTMQKYFNENFFNNEFKVFNYDSETYKLNETLDYISFKNKLKSWCLKSTKNIPKIVIFNSDENDKEILPASMSIYSDFKEYNIYILYKEKIKNYEL